MKHAIQNTVLRSGINPLKITALSFSGQMHGLVMIDQNGKSPHSSIIWCDQRTADIVKRSSTLEMQEFFSENTGNKLYTGFLLPSLLWIREVKPEVFEKIYKVCCPKDYLRYRLTGDISTDQTDASSTLAFDVFEGKWSQNILDRFDLDKSLFPDVGLPLDFAGTLLPSVANELGLSNKCKVYFGGSDQVMQAIGNGIVDTGSVSITIGTGGQVLTVLPKYKSNPLLNVHTFNFVEKNSWYSLGATLSAGQSLKWLKEKILKKTTYQHLDQLAELKPPGSEGLLFLPYLLGERTPHSDPNASGMFFGLSLKHDNGNLIRRVLEGVAFSLKDCINILSRFDVSCDYVIASGGGAQSRIWLQILSNILDLPIYVSKSKEQAALGAAITALVGAEYFDSYREATEKAIIMEDGIVEPQKTNVSLYSEYYKVYQELYQINKHVMHINPVKEHRGDNVYEL